MLHLSQLVTWGSRPCSSASSSSAGRARPPRAACRLPCVKTYIFLSLSLSIYIYIYVYMYTHIHVCVYIYIYIYTDILLLLYLCVLFACAFQQHVESTLVDQKGDETSNKKPNIRNLNINISGIRGNHLSNTNYSSNADVLRKWRSM